MDRSHLSCTTVTFGGKLPDKLAAMAKAGFGQTELWPRDYYEHNEGPDIAIDLLAAHDLKVSCYQNLRNFEGMPPELRERKRRIATQVFDQMNLIGCQTLVLCSNISPQSSGDPARIVADLRELGDLAEPYGVRVAWEPICWGRWVRDYREAWKLVQRVDHPRIGLVLDSFHVFALELPVDGIGGIDRDKIFIVEVGDLARSRLDFLEISRSSRLFPGEGVTAIPSFMEQVARTGYDGVYSVEVFNSYYQTLPPDAVAERAMTSLRGLFA